MPDTRANGVKISPPDLLPRALDLAAGLGSVPSRNRIMADLGVGAEKASRVRAELAARLTSDPGPDPGLKVGSGGSEVGLAQNGETAPEQARTTYRPGSEGGSGRVRRQSPVAWLAFLIGSGASVAANVAHARPELGPRLVASFAPLALVLAVELAVRVPWRPGWRWSLGRWGGTGLVAVVTAVVSYRHQTGLLIGYGEDAVSAAILPLSVDGLMLVAAAALLAVGRYAESADPDPHDLRPRPRPGNHIDRRRTTR
jgi:hypothetical protein